MGFEPSARVPSRGHKAAGRARPSGEGDGSPADVLTDRRCSLRGEPRAQLLPEQPRVLPERGVPAVCVYAPLLSKIMSFVNIMQIFCEIITSWVDFGWSVGMLLITLICLSILNFRLF